MPSRSAASRASLLARTLKPMIGAPEASASVTSDSVMPPTPACRTRAATSSVPSLSSAPTIASTEPCTSPLMTSGNSLRPRCLGLRHHLLERAAHAGGARRRLLALLAGAVFGDFAGAASFSTTAKRSPASGAPEKPSTSTGVDGPALSIGSPLSDTSARTRPHSAPATTMSPTLQRAALHQHGRDRAAAAVELGFDHGAFGRAVADWP